MIPHSQYKQCHLYTSQIPDRNRNVSAFEFKEVRLIPVVLHVGDADPSGDIWWPRCLETFLLVTAKERAPTGIEWREARDVLNILQCRKQSLAGVTQPQILVVLRLRNPDLCSHVSVCVHSVIFDSLRPHGQWSHVHGISLARILESIAIHSSSQGSNPSLLHLLHRQADSLPLCCLILT